MACLTAYVFNDQPITVLFDDKNNAWFKGKDVAEILGYSNLKKALLTHVSEKYKSTQLEIVGTYFESQLHYNDSKIIYISEPGLYEFIFSSKLPLANEFKYWVFEEVLPSIRKYGEYKLKRENQHLCQSLKESLASKAELKCVTEILEKKLNDQKPKVAVLPDDPELNHVFCVLIKESYLELYGVYEYKCVRTEKRFINNALKKAENEGFEICYYRENVANSVNILNRVKEVMRYHSMHYESAFNNILTAHNLVNIVEHILDHE